MLIPPGERRSHAARASPGMVFAVPAGCPVVDATCGFESPIDVRGVWMAEQDLPRCDEVPVTLFFPVNPVQRGGDLHDPRGRRASTGTGEGWRPLCLRPARPASPAQEPVEKVRPAPRWSLAPRSATKVLRDTTGELFQRTPPDLGLVTVSECIGERGEHFGQLCVARGLCTFLGNDRAQHNCARLAYRDQSGICRS